MPLPVAFGEVALAAVKSEAAGIMLRRLGDYVWPKIAGKTPSIEAAEDPIEHLAKLVSERPTRDELAQALENHEERVAALLDTRSAADLLVIRRWLVMIFGIQVLLALAILGTSAIL